MVAILVAMGKGFGWLTKPGKIVWSEKTKHLLAR